MESVRVAIVGSGFAGLGMAIRLKQRGNTDFAVLEKADDVGGTWRDNTYPGCQCDVPSHLYSFSFAPNPKWTRTYSMQAEIWDYLRDCARRYTIPVRFGTELISARWDEAEKHWHLLTTRGELRAQFLVDGTGPLSEPSVPALPGLETFAGARFHSAQWDHGHDLSGERVAVIGTGASAIQLVPQIQPAVERLLLFQRTPPWILPHRDRPIRPLAKMLYRVLPPAQLAVRAFIYWTRELFVIPFMKPERSSEAEKLGTGHLQAQVADPTLRALLTPSYKLGCKRVLISNTYYPAITQPNVELVTEGIREVRPHSVVTGSGAEHAVDTLILATGFKVTASTFAERITGRDGRLLSEAWASGREAYRGTSVAGFPNYFVLLGPNTGLGHTSVVFMIEAQINYVIDCMKYADRRGVAVVEVRGEVQKAYNEEIQARLRDTVWNSGGCASWYLDANGRNSTIWPGFTWPFRRLTRHFDPASYELSPA